MSLPSKSSLTPREIQNKIDAPVKAINDEIGSDTASGTIKYRIKALEDGGGGGGEAWTELASTDWTTHVFAVGDRLRFTFKADIHAGVTATDWNTLPTFGTGTESSSNAPNIIETKLLKLGGNALQYSYVRTPGATVKYAEMSYLSWPLGNDGKLAPYVTVMSIAFNGGGAVSKSTSLTSTNLTSNMLKVEYIPAPPAPSA